MRTPAEIRDRIRAIAHHPVSKYSWTLAVIQGISLVIAWYLFQVPPSSGVAVAILGLVAIIMAVRVEEEWGRTERIAWLVIATLLMIVEIRSIQGEHDRHDADQVALRIKEDRSREEERNSFADLLKQEQRHFKTTITTNLSAQKEERNRFSALLKKEDDLFIHEEQLAESLNGRLIPASDPTPSNICPAVGKDSILLFLGEESDHVAVLVGTFPHIVLGVGDFGPALTLERSPDGSLVIDLDIRSGDGRLITRLNKDGFVVNRTNFLEMHKDKSTVVLPAKTGHLS